VRAALLPELARTATELLAAARPGIGSPARLERTAAAWLTALVSPVDDRPVAADPAPALARSLDVAVGRRPPDLSWALGEAWRGLYPVISGVGGHGGVPDPEWAPFGRLAAEMERLAFGPPPVNVAKMLALVEAGRVDLRHVARGRLAHAGGRTELRSAAGALEIDLVVDAVLAPPGAAASPGDPIAGLLADGFVRLAPGGRRGIEVLPDGRCVSRTGAITPGLAVIGRATEDWVIGNDTLSRGLHGHPDRWARAVARRASVGGARRVRPAAPVAT
jgi:diaminopimelate decarboxylase